MNKKIVTLLKMILLSLGLIAAVSVAGKNKGHKVDFGEEAGTTSHYFAMGTSISVSVYSEDKSVDENSLKEKIVEDIKRLDQQVLSWRSTTSELGEVNNNTVGSTQISEELYVVLKQSLQICKDSEGALDITIRPLAALWNIEGDNQGEFVPPTKEEIDEVLKLVDYEAITLLSERYSTSSALDEAKPQSNENTNYYVTCASEGIIVDLGATGKGYALDKAKAVLEDSKVEGALVTVGGSILVYGEKADKSSFKVGVRDPLKPNDTNAMIGYLEFAPGTITCVSTSGGYEKFKTYEGKDYHHILDSKTGYPSDSGLLSVTVVCDNGLASDGLSTACFVLGYEKSLPLLEKYDAEAIFMDSNGDIIVTDGLKDCWVEQ